MFDSIAMSLLIAGQCDHHNCAWGPWRKVYHFQIMIIDVKDEYTELLRRSVNVYQKGNTLYK